MNQLSSLNPVGIPPEDEALGGEVRAFLVQAMRGTPAHVRARPWSGYDPAFSREVGGRGWLGIRFNGMVGATCWALWQASVLP